MENIVLELARITRAVSSEDEPLEQVRLVVTAISEIMDVEVCSLYMVGRQQDMVLLASHGLASSAVGNARLPKGKGLVGLIAESRHPLNIAEAKKHPAYHYVEESQEERFQSFCGVPLVRAGDVTGVLVVQGSNPAPFTDEEQAFLVTLAAHLTLLLIDYADDVFDGDTKHINLRVQGIKAAPGVAVGVVHLCKSGELFEVQDNPCDDVEVAIADWHRLLESVRDEVASEQCLLETRLPGSVSTIFDAYQLLLNDRALIDGVETAIRNGNWLPGALRQTVKHYSDAFKSMDDPYLKARHEDVQLLGSKLYRAWLGKKEAVNVIGASIILVGKQVSISDIADIPSENLSGIICYEGSRFSHAAVVANAMGIPAVMGVNKLKLMHDDDQVIVDGYQGNVILRPSESVRDEFCKLVSQEQQQKDQLQSLRDVPAVTLDDEAITLYTNTGLLADISPGLKTGAQGVGLYRTEIPFMMRDSFPSEEEQVAIYAQVLDAYAGKPVYMRTLDIGGDKQLPYFPIHNEENPALGWRGIRFSLDNCQLLMTQVRAMIRAAKGQAHLHILLPMVSANEELVQFRKLLRDACSQLEAEGYDVVRPKVGVMIEVPAAISQLPYWADKLDYVSIGTNDLSQYLLALDRNNARVASRFDHLHPAVLAEIARVIRIARQYRLPLSVCGEMAADGAGVVLLMGMGVRTLSMSSAKLLSIKGLIRDLSLTQAKLITTKALKCHSTADIRASVSGDLQDLGLGKWL